jgi:hypothetical protein
MSQYILTQARAWKTPIKGVLVAAAMAAVLLLSGCSFFGFLDSIEVRVNGTTTTSYSFGALVDSTPSSPVTVTIVNTGLFPLTFGGTSAIAIGGNAASDFTISGSPGDTIEAGGSVSFSLTFTPGGTGSRSASVTITPSGGGGSSTFSVSGTGTSQGQIAVADISATAVTSGSTYDAGTMFIGQTITFNITNNDTTNQLQFSATPVTVNSSDGSFSVSTQPTGPVAANGGTTSFTLYFSTAQGDASQKSATVTIGNTATGLFTFTITALSSGSLG